jgi:hypothetical protein
MYAVVSGGLLLYLGDCRDNAMTYFNDNECMTPSLHTVADITQLATLLDHDNRVVAQVDDPLNQVGNTVSSAFKGLVDQLDQLGVNQDLATKVMNNGEKLVGEAKSLGVKGMNVVGEGFVALGELLRKASTEEKQKAETNGTVNHSCCGGGGGGCQDKQGS